MGCWDSYCKLCGVSITTTCTSHHATARGLLRTGRWSKVGVGGVYGSVEEFYGEAAQGTSELQANFNPDLSSSCWFRMEDVEDVLANFYYEDHESLENDFGFPFHASCAKWIDFSFNQQSLPITKLVEFFLQDGFIDECTSSTWSSQHQACPDDAGIQSTQEQSPELQGSHAYVLSRPDTLWWLGDLVAKKYGLEMCDDIRAAEADWKNVKTADVPGPDEPFDMYSPLHLFLVREGSYEGSIELTPLPQIGEVGYETRHQPFSSPCSLPPAIVDEVVRLLGSGYTSLNLLSTSRSWYAYGRRMGWRLHCVRDGFARVPTRTVQDCVAEYDAKEVDWKRLYFCSESRNFRRIAKNVQFLLKVSRR
ncbi:hypothetical protein DFJ73DRAFT_819556, partial [Zopfochytrium polystomum]